MHWRNALALAAVAGGYGAAYYLVGGTAPNHRKLLAEIMTRQVVEMAEGFISN